jgi:hypothetical protein
MLVKLNGEFFAKRHAPADFRSAKKFDEIDPRKLFVIYALFVRIYAITQSKQGLIVSATRKSGNLCLRGNKLSTETKMVNKELAILCNEMECRLM